MGEINKEERVRKRKSTDMTPPGWNLPEGISQIPQ